MSKSLVLGLVGLVVAVVLFMVMRGGDSTTDTDAMQASGSVAATADGKGKAAANPDLQARGPKSLGLGRPAPGSGKAEGTGTGSDAGKGAGSKSEIDQYRQAHRPPAGSRGPRHQGREDSGDEAANVEVKSGVEATERLAEGVTGGTQRGGVANRPVVDDWAAVEAVDDPGKIREPEPGEVVTLFEGDPVSSQTEATIAKDVKFDDKGAEFNPDSEYAIPMAGKMKGDTGSISFWVRPDGETTDTDNASLVQLRSANEWANRLQIWKDGSNVRMVFADGEGHETGSTYGSDAWPADEWRQVTVTWGDKLNTLYVNGQLAGTNQYEGGFQVLPNTLLHVGSNYKDDPRSLTGMVSKFRVYNRTLTPDEVSTLPTQYPD